MSAKLAHYENPVSLDDALDHICQSGLAAAQPISSDIMRARYVSINDSLKDTRRIWLQSVLHRVDDYEYHEGETNFLSVASGNYDAMIFGGRDVRRLRNIFRQNEMILRQKVKLSVVNGCSPRDRADLLNCGFDDVLDIGRVCPEEAVARLLSIWRRHCMAMENDRAVRAEKDRLAGICDPGQLHARQRKALTMLLEANKKPVRYSTLQTELSLDHNPLSMTSLKVFICTLRKKITNGAQICSVNEIGYVLN